MKLNVRFIASKARDSAVSRINLKTCQCIIAMTLVGGFLVNAMAAGPQSGITIEGHSVSGNIGTIIELNVRCSKRKTIPTYPTVSVDMIVHDPDETQKSFNFSGPVSYLHNFSEYNTVLESGSDRSATRIEVDSSGAYENRDLFTFYTGATLDDVDPSHPLYLPYYSKFIRFMRPLTTGAGHLEWTQYDTEIGKNPSIHAIFDISADQSVRLKAVLKPCLDAVR